MNTEPRARISLLILGLLALSAVSIQAATNLTVIPTNTDADPDNVELTWTSTAPVATNVTWLYYEIRLATSMSANASFSFQARYTTNVYLMSGLETNKAHQWKIEEFYEVVTGGQTNIVSNLATNSFTTGPANPNKATSPQPASKSTLLPAPGTNIIHNGVSWNPGPAVATNTNVSYNVYFGKDATPDETEFRGNTTGTNFLPGKLEEHTRYYWRVDTVVNGTNVHAGRLWSFVTRGREDIFMDSWMKKGVKLVPTNTPSTNASSGGWVSSTNGTGFRGFDFLHDNDTNKGQMSVTFSPTIPVAGRYEVFARWGASPSNSSNTPITVNYDGGTTTLTMNQRSSAGLWRRLGTFNFQAGTNGKVVISNPAGTTGRVVADAVRFLSVETNTVFTNSERILFMDSFSHGAPNTVLSNGGWKVKTTAAQLRSSTNIGQYVKVAGTNWIEKAVDTRGVTNIIVSYSRQTSDSLVFTPEWSIDGGQNWTTLGAEVVVASAWTNVSQACGAQADHQQGFRLRFRTAGASSSYAYIDNVTVQGVPAPEPVIQSPNTTNPIVKANVIFLGDSTTSNDGDNAYHWTDTVQNRLDLAVFRAPILTNANGTIIRPTNHGKGGSKAYDGQSTDSSSGFGPYGPPDPTTDGGGYQRLRYAYEVDHYTNAKFVLIDFGMNDHKINKVGTSGTNFAEVRTVPAFSNHLTAIVNLVRTNGATPVMIVPHDIDPGQTYDANSYSSTYPPEHFSNTNWGGSAIGRFHQFTQVIRQVAQDHNVDLIDVNAAASEYDPEEITVKGGVHMSEAGHRVYGEVISRYLSERFRQAP